MACPVNTGQAFVPTPVNLGIRQQQTHSMAGMAEGLSVMAVGEGGSAENCANRFATQSGSAAAFPSASPEDLQSRCRLGLELFKRITSTLSPAQPPRDQTPAKTPAHQSLASLVEPHLLNFSPPRNQCPTLSPQEERRLRRQDYNRKQYIRTKEKLRQKLLTLSPEERSARRLRHNESNKESYKRNKETWKLKQKKQRTMAGASGGGGSG